MSETDRVHRHPIHVRRWSLALIVAAHLLIFLVLTHIALVPVEVSREGVVAFLLGQHALACASLFWQCRSQRLVFIGAFAASTLCFYGLHRAMPWGWSDAGMLAWLIAVIFQFLALAALRWLSQVIVHWRLSPSETGSRPDANPLHLGLASLLITISLFAIAFAGIRFGIAKLGWSGERLDWQMIRLTCLIAWWNAANATIIFWLLESKQIDGGDRSHVRRSFATSVAVVAAGLLLFPTIAAAISGDLHPPVRRKSVAIPVFLVTATVWAGAQIKRIH